MDISSNLMGIYNKLLETYSHQGWWPFLSHDGVNPTKKGSINGYHPKDYGFPKNESQKFEVALGAILTQNTAWTSVENALINLSNLIGNNINTDNNANIISNDNISNYSNYTLTPENVLFLYENENDNLKDTIRCAGFVNQKTNYIKNIAEFFIDLNGDIPRREELLKVKGVGNETADSILLYGFKQCEFIVDAYTTRIFTYLGYINSNGTKKNNYNNIKKLFEDNLKRNNNANDSNKGNINANNNLDTVIMFQEYHALIVEHGKRYYSKQPYGINDTVLVDYFCK